MDSELLRRHVATHAHSDIAGSKMSGPILWRLRDQYVARHLSTHESGHAVIGRVLNLPCGLVTIVHDETFRGHAEIADERSIMDEWRCQGRRRSEATMLRAQIMAGMAGREAEVVILGDATSESRYDREEIARLLHAVTAGTHVERLEARLRSWTRTLCRRYAQCIKAVADTLLREGTLTDAQVRSLIGVEKRPYVARLEPSALAAQGGESQAPF
jgi:hypothetical protein